MLAAQKVVKFENENMKVYDIIQAYFKELSLDSRDYVQVKDTTLTKKAYESDLRTFFQIMRGKEKGKELEYLTMDDITITQDDFEEYDATLCELKKDDGSNKYVNKTINRKETALKGFIKFLKKKKYIDIDISYLELVKGKKERKNHYGVLEADEVLNFVKLCKQERYNGKAKELLILCAFKTGLRKAEILNLKWTDFQIKDDTVCIKGVGKGNKEFEIYITKDFYEELLVLNKGQEFVFEIGTTAIDEMMTRFVKKLKLSKERNLCFHSIRKCFGTMIWLKTGDIERARRALRHESVKTTQIYLNVDNSEMKDIVLNVEKIDPDLYKMVSYEELLEGIEGLPKSIQMLVNMKLSENQSKK